VGGLHGRQSSPGARCADRAGNKRAGRGERVQAGRRERAGLGKINDLRSLLGKDGDGAIGTRT